MSGLPMHLIVSSRLPLAPLPPLQDSGVPVCVFTRILVGLRIELTGFFPTSSVIGVDLGGETATASAGSDLGTLDKAGSSLHHP